MLIVPVCACVWVTRSLLPPLLVLCSVLIEPAKTCTVRSLVQGLLFQDDLHIP